MSDLLVLVVLIVLPAAVALGPLAVLTLGIAAVSDLDGQGLVTSLEPREVRSQPAATPSTLDVAPDRPLTSGPAARTSSVTPSA